MEFFKLKHNRILNQIITNNRILAIVTCLFMVLSPLVSMSSVSEETDETLTYTFSFNEPSITQMNLNNTLYSKVSINGCFETNSVIGSPKLPIRFVELLLPPGKTVESIDFFGHILTMNSIKNEIKNMPIVPKQRETPIGGPPETFVVNEDVYNSDETIPQKTIVNHGESSSCGYQILTLSICPLQYNPKTGIVSYYDSMTVNIELTDTDPHPLFRGKNEDEQWVKKFVINPDMTEEYDTPKLSSFEYSGGLCDPSDTYDYVIITRDALVDFTSTYNWTDFINHNQQKNLDTTIVSVESITSCPDYYNSSSLFNDTAAQIREFCRDAYQDWGIQYVLIAGDQDGPNAIQRRLMDSGAESNVETDLYWSNLDNTFNNDGDNDWGEEGDTGFDFYSELFIGSLPCDTGDDISNWMTKSFYYENNDDQDYLENVAFYGGDLDSWLSTWYSEGDDFMDFTLYGTDNWMGPTPNHDGPWPSFLGFLYGFDTWNQSHPDGAFNTSIRWTGEGDDPEDDGPNPGWQGGSESLSVAGLKNAINADQCTIINAIAHSAAYMSLDVEDSDWESDYHNTKPFFLHDYGCHSGDMDADDDGVLHSMLFHSDVELAFATVMNTGYGWGNLYCTNSSSALQQKLFWDYMLNLSKCGGRENWQLGKAQAYSKNMMAPTIDYEDTFREIIQCCLLFGDPAQRIKSPTPLLVDEQISTVNQNWNFISLPFNQTINTSDFFVECEDVNYTWADAVSNMIVDGNVYGWNRGPQTYYLAENFSGGYGYWIYSYENCSLWVRNVSLAFDPTITNLDTDWNMVGIPYDKSVNKFNLTITHDGTDYTWEQATNATNHILDSNVFGWDSSAQTYNPSNILDSGKSYWIYTYESCQMQNLMI